MAQGNHLYPSKNRLQNNPALSWFVAFMEDGDFTGTTQKHNKRDKRDSKVCWKSFFDSYVINNCFSFVIIYRLSNFESLIHLRAIGFDAFFDWYNFSDS